LLIICSIFFFKKTKKKQKKTKKQTKKQKNKHNIDINFFFDKI